MYDFSEWKPDIVKCTIIQSILLIIAVPVGLLIGYIFYALGVHPMEVLSGRTHWQRPPFDPLGDNFGGVVFVSLLVWNFVGICIYGRKIKRKDEDSLGTYLWQWGGERILGAVLVFAFPIIYIGCVFISYEIIVERRRKCKQDKSEET